MDSSAYVKTLLCEAERGALLVELAEWEGYVSSALLAVESVRACARRGAKYARDARGWLEGISLLPLDDAILDIAIELEPAGLRSLDALHLATALSIRDEIGVLVTYDERLGQAAKEQGLKISQPA
ncbi:MAG TPA: type II toxin-antitoxin system VapC family toxin [Solirubrobacterales bacterium]|nr:type II toxin-antitoxin system VapC family toxin [Solirubrobacterales bacterium]